MGSVEMMNVMATGKDLLAEFKSWGDVVIMEAGMNGEPKTYHSSPAGKTCSAHSSAFAEIQGSLRRSEDGKGWKI